MRQILSVPNRTTQWMIIDIVSVLNTSLCRRYRKYVQLGLGAFAALVVYERHVMQNICNLPLLCLFTLLPRRLTATLNSNSAPRLRNDRIRRDKGVFIPSLSRLLAESWNDLPSIMSEATFIACWRRIFAPLDKGWALLNRILPRPWPLCVRAP